MLRRILLLPLVGLLFIIDGKAQCSVDYSTTNYFCDLDSLLLHAIPAIGQPPFSFLWETGETTQTIMIPLALGDYMVTMTDANGCVATINCHIKPFPQVLYYPYNQNACEGDTVLLELEWFRDSIPGALYEWSTGETTPSIQLTDDITWSVTVTDPTTGCEFIIDDSPFPFWENPEVEIIGPTEICGEQSITLSLEGGPFDGGLWLPEWIWGYTYEVTEPGMYVVIVSNPEASFCHGFDTVFTSEGDMPPPQLTGPPNLCEGQNGTITITNSASYTSFLWNTGENTSSIAVDEPGTYTVTVSNATGCVATASLTVGDNAGPSGVLSPTAATCGLSNGSIDLTMTPPGNYLYAWSNGSSTQDISNVPPGDYEVTITDLNGCTSIIEEMIPDQPLVITINETITPNSSCNGFNGAINISVLPAGNYDYAWSNGADTEDISGLGPGAYTVTVTTGLTCIATDDFVIDDVSNAADINPIITVATCGLPNGSIDLQLVGGTAPFVFSWSNGDVVEDLSDLAAGSYAVTVTGSDGCVSVTSVTVPNENVAIDIQGSIIPNSSCDQSNGAVDINVLPAIDYLYSWSNGAASEDLFDIGAGTYTVTVTSGNSCVQTASFTVTNENTPFAITGNTQPDISCIDPSGAIDVSVTPAGAYTFQWSTGSQTEDLQGLVTGVYEVTVTNADNCAITASFAVDQATPSIAISGITINNSSCQVPNGSLDIAITPGGNYSFIWSTGATSEDLQDIGAGAYAVTVADQNGCSADTSFTVLDSSTPFALSALTNSNTVCVAANGSIDLTIAPAGSYVFIWSNGNTTEDLQGLSAGSYSVTVTDPNQCVGIDTFIVSDNTPPMDVTAVITGDTCNAGRGGIDLTVLPGSNSYLWSNGSTVEDLSDVAAGAYFVTITNASGCVATDSFLVNNVNNSFTISGNSTNNTSCNTPTGAIDLSITPSGPYTILWSNGMATEDLSQLNEGIYKVTVSDAAGCSSVADFNIQDLATPIAVSYEVGPSHCAAADGFIELGITPATGNTVIWSNGSSNEDLIGITAGNYFVTITNGNGCDTSLAFVIPDSGSTFIASAITSSVTDCDVANGAIDLSIEPVGSYTYAWSNGMLSEDLGNLTAGSYTVTITDAFACTLIETFSIAAETSSPIITAAITEATCGQPNGSISLSVESDTGYLIQWSTGSADSTISSLIPGVYEVTVTAENGCTATGEWTVANVNTNFEVASSTANITSCIVSNGFIDLTVTPPGNYSFAWSNGASTEDLSDLSSGLYTVTVTDVSLCASIEQFEINDAFSTPVISGDAMDPMCGRPTGSIAISVEPPGDYQVSWNTGDTLTTISQLSAGTYSVLVADQLGCEAEATFELFEQESLEANIDASIDASGTGMVHCSLMLNVPMSSIASIEWTPDEQMSCHDTMCIEQDILVLARTEVQARITDINGCTAIASLLLNIDKEYKVYIPNVFTPNEDGPNDRFTVYGNEEIEQIVLLEIFDRWGNNVFINEEFPPNESQYGWDGFFKGQLMNPAVFVYHAIVLLSNGETQHYAGDVTLIR
jgi:gliding motility-associated-like protein